MEKSLVYVLLSMTCGAICAGQQTQPSAGFSPVPTVTAGTVVPDDSPQYVFLGPTIYDITLSYPKDLASGTRSGPRQTYKLKMLNRVSPVVSAVVTVNADGSYDYAYTVQNDASARDSIKVWSIAMPAVDAVSSATHSVWRATAERAPGHPAPPPGGVSMTPVVFTTWRGENGLAIAPGKALTAIHIKSVLRPGFTMLYARSEEDYAVPADVPQEVRDQLEVFRAPHWRDRAVLVVGPRFPKEWGREIVAGEFKHAVARLTGEGRLTADSKFVSLVNQILDTLNSAGGAALPLDSVLSLASTPTEVEIAHAIAISLR